LTPHKPTRLPAPQTMSGSGSSHRLHQRTKRALLVGAAAFGAVCYGQVAILSANAATTPRVLSIEYTPAQVGPNGGTVAVTAKVRNASTCGIDLRSHPLFPVAWTTPGSCKTTFTTYVKIGVNASSVKRAVALDLRASDGKAFATSRVFYISIGSKVVQSGTTPTTEPPASTTTTTTPPAIGGVGGFLPPPTPTTTPPTTAPTTTVTPSTTTTVQPVTTTTSSPTWPGLSIDPDQSGNWSGYELDGGPFTSVSGTFTVPYLTSDAACGEFTSEWVGVDGDTLTEPDDDTILQAGVSEGEQYVTTSGEQEYGDCTPVDEFDVSPWWESYPAPPYVLPITIQAGDSVTVTISQSGGYWSVTAQDGSQVGTESFNNVEAPAYTGPATSAEWITEAPGDNTTLAPYCAGSAGTCTTDTVTYSNLGVAMATNAAVSAGYAIQMWQNGYAVSVPSAVSTVGQLLADGFTTSYE
jgi:hypothetical protein